MNTGFLGPAVTTVLTVYGIETSSIGGYASGIRSLQQYLPFTVLKLKKLVLIRVYFPVTTVLTVYGIETALN